MITYNVLVADKHTEGSIRGTINNDLVPAVAVVHQAQAWLWLRLRLREMLATATGTLAQGADTVAIPERFVAARHFQFTGAHKAKVAPTALEQVEAAMMWDADGARVPGKPTLYCPDAAVLQFDRPALEAYPYRFRYYAALAPLSSANPANVLTGKGFRALMCACMAFASEWDKADEKDGWMLRAEDEVQRLNMQADEEMHTGTETQVMVI